MLSASAFSSADNIYLARGVDYSEYHSFDKFYVNITCWKDISGRYSFTNNLPLASSRK